MTNLETSTEPVRDAATGVAKWTGLLGALVTSLVGFGVLTLAQGDALTGLLGAIPGVVAWVATAVGAFRVAQQARPLVTPLVNPRNVAGVQLVPQGRV